MGHRVSTIAPDDLRPSRRRRTAAAFAILIAVNYATASTTTCAFLTPSLHNQHKNAPSCSLFATASIASAVIASVPPPGSKLYQLRYASNNNNGQRRPSSSSSSSRNNGKRGRTDLRYATHVDSSSSCPPTSSSQVEADADVNSHAALRGDEDSPQYHQFFNGPTNDVNSTRQDASERPSSLRKRRRMLKYLNRQFSRLNVKLKQAPTMSPSSSFDLSTNSTDYQQRKAAWAAKYTSLSTLRSTFGSNKNRFWGDFDPTTTRKLYHTLIPRALLALHDMGLSDVDELAPLAYQARMAAKKYARERSRLPGRIGSMVYDGWRQWRRYGKWAFDGMSWEQIWDKYESQILRETVGEVWLDGDEGSGDGSGAMQSLQLGELNDEELTTKICMRILERSVVTNEAIDKLFLERLVGKRDKYEEEEEEDKDLEESSVDTTPSGAKRKRQERRRQRTLRIQADLKAIEKKFDEDIRELLRHSGLATEEGERRRRNRSSGSFFWSKSESTSAGASEGSESFSSESAVSLTRGGGAEEGRFDYTATLSSEADVVAALFSLEDGSAIIAANDGQMGTTDSTSQSKTSVRKLSVHEVFALRILASTKKRIAYLQNEQEDDESISPKQ
ncbi:hypothetical protein HJC23_010990 [Cyclotella cryptica]|uniref:Uncharacterized protein n=1 Tax=Cyclotella cryptica TaxID=29204 RepID=A0ABD3PYN4_9STRA|eukprot:CCRYP_010299-RA/>CCRYP_010299-RA protein AED:0.00 eAED:0.00 QI:617/-1/1/1/-1/1/1/76/616